MDHVLTPAQVVRYLEDVDPLLRRLEALTDHLVAARVALGGDTTPEACVAFIDACETDGDALVRVSQDVVDAKGRLLGILLPPADSL
jgi:hypothetical protein